GTAVPPTAVDQGEAARITANLCCRAPEHRSWLPLLFKQTGILKRHTHFSDAVYRDLAEGTALSGSKFLPTGDADDAGPTTSQRMQAYRDAAEGLSAQAAQAAMDAANLRPADVTHVITVSCTGFHSPGPDHALIRRLALVADVARIHIGFM